MKPLVSILIPAYNVEPYIYQCLESVLRQSFDNLQVVVVDDGSTDETSAILDDYSTKDPRLEIIHKNNGGVASARNELLRHVRGDWFLFVDADDWIEPDIVEKLLQVAMENNADIAMCGMMSDNEHVRGDEGEIQVWDRETAIHEFIRHERISGSLWNKLIRRTLLEHERQCFADSLPFDPVISYGEDALFTWHILQGLKSIAITPLRLYHYRRNQSSISHSHFDARKMSGHLVWQQFVEDVTTHWPRHKSLVTAAFAVSDFWLLFYASLNNYPFDENIYIYQCNLRNNLLKIRHHKLLSTLKLLAATVIAYNYRLGAFFLRLSQ